MSWHNEDDIKIIFDLTNEVTRLTAEVERLKRLEDMMGSGWALVEGEALINENEELKAKLSRYEEGCLEYQHDLLRFQESEKSLAEELVDALKRAEQAEAKLSRYQEGIEVEGIVAGNVELYDNGIVQVISEKLKPLIKQRVKVLILKEEVND